MPEEEQWGLLDHSKVAYGKKATFKTEAYRDMMKELKQLKEASHFTYM